MRLNVARISPYIETDNGGILSVLGINLVYNYCSNSTCSSPKFDEMGLNETAFADAVELALKEVPTKALKEVAIAPATNFACRADRNWGRS